MTVSFWTLGCKLNQTESDCLAAAFAAAGFDVVPQKGDLRVINTCTVTGKAEQKMRHIVRLERADENALLIVTGCAIKKREVQGRVFYLPAQDKPRLTEFPSRLRNILLEDKHYEREAAATNVADPSLQPSQKRKPSRTCAFAPSYATPSAGDTPKVSWTPGIKDAPTPSPDPGVEQHPVAETTAHRNVLQAAILDWFTSLDPITPADPFVFEQGLAEYAASPRSRPFLKIQDGCGNACTYCAVTIVRGPSASLDKTAVLERLCFLEDAGFSEAVLTGVNICSYPDLAGLIAYLLENTGRIRLRLSSLEPDAVDDRLLRAVSLPRVRPHFHLSVQSGSDAVLARMGRRYEAAVVERVCADLRAVKDDPFLACDIIAGFPGETEADFAATHALCEKAAFAWIHAFPFSPRPGTAAAKMRPQVPQREAVARVERLLRLAQAGMTAYEKRWEGRAVEAVIERYDSGDETINVVTENYLKRKLPREQIEDKKPGATIRIVDGKVVMIP
ncbi:MAG: radical SAM protein [Spirochaetaceae bacterium]|jgi:threonylcarbamoyladenosine tRNA methylthiotransferase MtaB|nr:radical SAM protein [Spirochaetaceae bacterium]